ncbi:MAG: phosphoribosylglycinamide formyltransferase [Clostridia bacterium]|nr:phosphoribosylglycinamide formyltransferase [Clostridia bacterium]
MRKKKIAVLVSGGGTNLQKIIDAAESGAIKNGEIAVVVSTSKKAYALERAKKHGIPAEVIARSEYKTDEECDERLLSILKEHNIDLVVLAGYLRIITPRVIGLYENRMINVHPSLIPSFCGDGFYGLKVHEAALAYGVKVTGATVHFVNEVTDGGAVILQKAVEVKEGDTPETLQRRVMEEAEWILLPRAVDLFCSGRIKTEGRRITITEEEG